MGEEGRQSLNRHIGSSSSSLANSQVDIRSFTYMQRWPQTHTQHAPSHQNPPDDSVHPPSHPIPQVNGDVVHGSHNQIYPREHSGHVSRIRGPAMYSRSSELTFQRFQPQLPESLPTFPRHEYVLHNTEADRGDEGDDLPGPPKRRRCENTMHRNLSTPLTSYPSWEAYDPYAGGPSALPDSQDDVPYRPWSPEVSNNSEAGASFRSSTASPPGVSLSQWRNEVAEASARSNYPSYVYTGQDSDHYSLHACSVEVQTSSSNYQVLGTTTGTIPDGILDAGFQYTANNDVYDYSTESEPFPECNAYEDTSQNLFPTADPSFSSPTQEMFVTSTPLPAQAELSTSIAPDASIIIPPLEERFTSEEFNCKWPDCTKRLIRTREVGETDDTSARERLQVDVHEHIYQHAKPSTVCLWERCIQGDNDKRGRVARLPQDTLEIPLEQRRTFRDARSLRRHIFSCHLGVRLVCGLGSCVQIFNRESALKRHRSACTGEPKVKKSKKRARS